MASMKSKAARYQISELALSSKMSSSASTTNFVNCIYCKSGIRGVDRYREHLFEVHSITAEFVQGNIEYDSDMTWPGKEDNNEVETPTDVNAQPVLVKTEDSGENSAGDESNVNSNKNYQMGFDASQGSPYKSFTQFQ